VVVDKRFNKTASTGMFELIYRQHISQTQPYQGLNLSVCGTKVHHTVPIPRSQTSSDDMAEKTTDSSKEQKSYSSTKKKSIMVQHSCSTGLMMKNSNGSSEKNMFDNWTGNNVTQNKSGMRSESEELFSQQSEQTISKENIMVIHSKGNSVEQDRVSSESEYKHSQLNELTFSDTDFEMIQEKNPNIHRKNNTNFTLVTCEDEEMKDNEIGLNCSRSNSVEQGSPNSALECMMMKTVRQKISERHQLTSIRTENMLQIKKSEDSSDDREAASSGPELKMQKERSSIRVKNFKVEYTEHGTVSSRPDDMAQKNKNATLKKSWSTPNEQETVRGTLEKNLRRDNNLKKYMEENPASSGSALTLRNKKNYKEEMCESSDEQHSVNSEPKGTSPNKTIRMTNSQDTSKKQKSTNNWPEYIRERKRDATRKIIRDSSEEQEVITNESENKLQKNDSIIKYLRECSEDELNSETESPSQKKRKNSWEKNSSNRYGTDEQHRRIKQSRNQSTEKDEISNSSNMQKKIKKTAGYIEPIILDFIDDLTKRMNKTKTPQSDKIAVYTASEHKKTKPSNKSSPGSSTVTHGKGSIIQKGTHIVFSQGGTKFEMQEGDVMDVQESERISKNETSIMQEKIYGKAPKTAGKSWSYPKEGLSVSHFTEAIYPCVEEVITKRKKPYSSEWKNGSDAERSVEFFNEWKQKLDHMKASCEDMLAKLKMIRDKENIINKPKYYSIDKGISWEGETANRPTISDIIKKLSQAQPERELFICSAERRFIDTIPEHTLPDRKEKLKIKKCDLNMIIRDNMNYVVKHNERLCSEPIPTNGGPMSMAMRGILPNIKQRIKQPSPNSQFCSGHKMENFYAVGMSLKAIQASHNLKQRLLLPLGSDHCLGINSTIPAATQASFL
jgi:hypothetical protein